MHSAVLPADGVLAFLMIASYPHVRKNISKSEVFLWG